MKWATEYINNNIHRIIHLPSKMLVTDYFTPADWQDVEGMSLDEMNCLNESLIFQFEYKKKQMNKDIEKMRPQPMPSHVSQYHQGTGPQYPQSPSQPQYGQPLQQNGQYSQQQPHHLQFHQSQAHHLPMMASGYPMPHNLTAPNGEPYRGPVLAGMSTYIS